MIKVRMQRGQTIPMNGLREQIELQVAAMNWDKRGHNFADAPVSSTERHPRYKNGNRRIAAVEQSVQSIAELKS